MLELHYFGVQSAQFALHAQRANFIGAATSYHAALVASAVGRDKGILRILTRQFFRRRRAVCQIRGAQPRQKLFRRRTKRISELHKLVEPRDDAVFHAEINNGIVLGGKTQVVERIHKESGSSAHFIAEHGNAGARVVVGFDDDVFQFVAQVLFDGGFVPLLDFSVISQHADGAKILPAAALVGGKKLLHSVRRVGAVVEYLRERRVPRADSRQ